MKNIDKIIHWNFIEISIMIAVIIVSFPLWKQLSIGDYVATAASYDNAQYSYLEVSDYQNSPMFPMSNDYAIKTLKPINIKVVNDTRTEEYYSLLISVSKTSTLNYKCLNVKFNDEIKSLEEYFFQEDSENYYFLLTSDSLIGSKKSYEFNMWMREETGNDMQGKTLNYSFELQKGMTI